ncbi:signal peptidase II, partial [Mesorhizobium sp. M7A.F.Ca.CA.004.04.2.1]
AALVVFDELFGWGREPKARPSKD